MSSIYNDSNLFEFDFQVDETFPDPTVFNFDESFDLCAPVEVAATTKVECDADLLMQEIDSILENNKEMEPELTDEAILKELSEVLAAADEVDDTETNLNLPVSNYVNVSTTTTSSKKRTYSEADLGESTYVASSTSASPLVKIINAKQNKKPKRPKPYFMYNEALQSRMDNYWNLISHNKNYKNIISKWNNDSALSPIGAHVFVKNAMPALIPNNLTINFFKKYQGIDNWCYQANTKRNEAKLPLRWCGQEMNFYETFVTRHKVDEYGKITQKQALCPYCPIESESVNLDHHFHSTQDSLYMHHVCKDHGVYSTGYELSPPLIAYDNKIPIAVCTECGEKCKMFNVGTGMENCMIAYFRHAFNTHNKKRHNRSNEQKRKDHLFFNGVKNLLYEKSNVNFNKIPKQLPSSKTIVPSVFMKPPSVPVFTLHQTELPVVKNEVICTANKKVSKVEVPEMPLDDFDKFIKQFGFDDDDDNDQNKIEMDDVKDEEILFDTPRFLFSSNNEDSNENVITTKDIFDEIDRALNFQTF
ncbi:hypothetical protein C6P40_005280 [Pichia californica]|uniref:Transcription regulator Rua1 C-terminal domain-containing protein n=1 Tax=Pichia californica TaxID=460514 RepID=A0A9P7BIG9_9ASCO|nr:hypothetical protein C6P42_000107 [[Candida] californica]KAG0691053.1 hypothetical protein C6P40_005280 [[Candida] californica]